MVTDVDRAYPGWSHEKLSDHDENRDVSASQMLDHGSISFGRFTFESLEWERKSVFNHNKYQEELQKLKCPGLVAQKKAFFEEHYKKIRAQKAMQANQQAELTVNYGADGSISSQSGEENKTASHLENLGNGVPNLSDAHSKEALIEITLEEKHNSEVIQMKQSDLEYPSSHLASLHGRHYSYAHQTQQLDMRSTVNEPFTRTEEVEQHDLSDFDGKEGSREYYKSEAIAKKGENFTYAVQVCGLERKSIMHKSLVRTEKNKEIEMHGVSSLHAKGILRKYDTLEENTEPEVSGGWTVLYPSISNAEKSELKANCIMVSEKTNPIHKRYKDSISVPNRKDISMKASITHSVKNRALENISECAVVRKQALSLEKQCNNIKGRGASVLGPSENRIFRSPNQHPDNKSLQNIASGFRFTNNGRMGKQEELISVSQSDVKSSREPKYPFEKGISMIKNCVGSDDTDIDEVSGNHKSSSFAPSRPLAELHSNITNSRIFSFPAERQSAVSKDVASRCGSKMLNILPSLRNHSKGVTNVQDISMKASIAQGVKNRGLENKSGCAVVRKQALALEKQCSNIKGKGAGVPVPSKHRIPRSSSQPHNQSLQNIASGFRFTNTGRMGKQGEVISSEKNHLPLHGRKPHIGGLSQIETKNRKVIPLWC